MSWSRLFGFRESDLRAGPSIAGPADAFDSAPQAAPDSTVCHVKHATNHFEDVFVACPMFADEVSVLGIEHSVQHISGESNVIHVANRTNKSLRYKANRSDEVRNRSCKLRFLERRDSSVSDETAEQVKKVRGDEEYLGILKPRAKSLQLGPDFRANALIKVSVLFIKGGGAGARVFVRHCQKG